MATFALLIWPVVSVILFSSLGRARGLIWTVLLGYLLLPVGWIFDFPLLPPFGKRESIALGVLLGVLVTRQQAEPLPKADPWAKGVITALLVLLFLTPFVTMMTNRDGYMIGRTWFPPINLWDVQSTVFAWLVSVTVFLFARRFLHSPEMHRELLKAMVMTGLFYSLLALYELRMSPQLNNIVYGYFPHSFLQHIRGGGFRPLVFLGHGLELGFFLLTVVLAGIGLLRATPGKSRSLFLAGTIALFIMLVMSRNLGALAICLLLGYAGLLFTPRTQVRIAVLVAILFTTYPLVRNVYIQPLLAAAESVSDERFRSLQFRFIHEDALLERALDRPVAGWGPWGRWRVYDENGGDITVSDGIWVIQLGQWGWMGFIGLFGLLMAPLLLMKRTIRYHPLSPLTSVMTLMVGANLIYMIPNASLSPMGWLVAGALAGYVQFSQRRTKVSVAGQPRENVKSRPKLQYTRFGPRNGVDQARSSRPN